MHSDDFSDSNYPKSGLPCLKFYRMYPDVVIPSFATSGSACFDIRAYFDNPEAVLPIYPGDSVVVPTGLIMDIPEGYHVKIYSRSGFAFKHNITLTNSVGIIDSDYVDEVQIMLHRHYERIFNLLLTEPIVIRQGDRIAQGMLVKNEQYYFRELEDRPKRKSERDGGYGSTGVK